MCLLAEFVVICVKMVYIYKQSFFNRTHLSLNNGLLLVYYSIWITDYLTGVHVMYCKLFEHHIKVHDHNTRLVLYSYPVCKMLCILTSKCMLAHVFAWSKTMKNAWKLSTKYVTYLEYNNTLWITCTIPQRNIFLNIFQREQYMSLSCIWWKKYFFDNFKCFSLFLTMQTHAQACVC